MATINLGAIRYNWKGAWSSSTAYVINDVVSNGGNSYVSIQAGTNQAVGNATAYWNIMSSAGTNGSNGSNGTDLTSTLTTQGDLLYRDGSGLQRLAKGSANQTLQMNGSANAPTWTTVAAASSDYVKITSGTVSSNVSQLDLSNIFSSTYNNYKIIFRNLAGQSAGWLQAQMLSSAGVYNDSQYYWIHNILFAEVTGNASNVVGHQGNTRDTRWYITSKDMGNVTGYSSSLEMDVFNPHSTAMATGVTWKGHAFYYNYSQQYFTGGGTDNNFGLSCTGLRFTPQNSIAAGVNYAVYGIKE